MCVGGIARALDGCVNAMWGWLIGSILGGGRPMLNRKPVPDEP
jgi:hypothetical protein